METKDLNKNFNLSAKFNEYAMQNPTVLDKLPENAHIVFIPEDKDLAKKNFEMAKKISQKQHRPVFGALQYDRGWKVEKLQFFG